MGASAALVRMPRLLPVLAVALASALPTRAAGEDETCAADGEGCVELPVYPDCEYSCDQRRCIGPNSGNTRQIWPECPSGPEGCKACADRHPDCPQFARAYGGLGCEDNPAFMIDVCAHSCNTCHLIDWTVRCKHLMDMPDSLEPGSVNQTFQRLLNIKNLNVKVLSEDPWIVMFPKFLTDEEIEFLKDENTRGPWSAASDTGEEDEHGRRQMVFSSNRKTDVAWCNCACQEHPVGRRLISRIGELLRVHPHYTESMQFLRYTKGMYYRPHHDAARIGMRNDPHNIGKHRVYTFFMYLTDVTKGGGTHFPQLSLKVEPGRGNAILWPSVQNDDPWRVDMRTEHEALPVEDGEKLSMNMWWYLGPHQLAHDISCSGSPIG